MTDYTLFGASHAAGTTLTKANVENGTGDATDTFSITAASLAGLEGDPGFTTAIGNADITLFVRHIPTSVESALYSENVGAITVASAFTPADLFAASEVGGWWDPSDLSTLWQDTAATTAVTADGQAVARMDDKSGNGYDFIEPTAANRPIYKTAGGLHWLEFDGVNDRFTVNKTVSLPSGSGFFVGHAQREIARQQGSSYNFADTNRISVHMPWSDGSAYFDVGGTGGSGTRINGAWVAVGTDVVVIHQRTSGDVHSVRRNGAAFGDTPTNTVTLTGTRYNLACQTPGNLEDNIRVYGTIFVEADKSADVSDVEAWLAAKAGVTL